MLKVEDCEVAAAQFMDACLATVFKPFLFNFGAAPANERIEYVVKIAVQHLPGRLSGAAEPRRAG